MTTPGRYIGVATDSPALDAPTANSLVVTTLTATNISGAIAGNVVGNVTGNLTGNVTGNLTGVVNSTSFADAISAAGTTQATGTILTKTLNNVSIVGAGAGVNLPASVAGLQVIIQNTDTNVLTVYPAQGAADTINGIAATIGVDIQPQNAGIFLCTLAGVWNAQRLGGNKSTAFNTNSATANTTLLSADISGGTSSVDLQLTGGISVNSTAQLPLVTDLLGILSVPNKGTTYRLRITNASSIAHTWTVTTNTGWTLAGTMTIAQNTWREFVLSFNSLTTATLQSAATGTYS